MRRWKWLLCLHDMGENWGTERKQRVQGHVSGKWQKQTSSPALANFSVSTFHNYTILALLSSQGTTAEARKSLLIQLTSVLNLSPFLCPQPQDFQYLLRPPPQHTHTKPHWEWENLGAGVQSVHGRQTSFGFCTQTNTDDKRNHKLSSWEPKAYFVFFTEEIKNLYTLPCLLQVKHLQDVLKPKTPSGFLQLLVLHLASASLFLYLFLSPTSLTPFSYLLAKPVARRESCIFTLQGDFLAGHILLYWGSDHHILSATTQTYV